MLNIKEKREEAIADYRTEACGIQYSSRDLRCQFFAGKRFKDSIGSRAGQVECNP